MAERCCCHGNASQNPITATYSSFPYPSYFPAYLYPQLPQPFMPYPYPPAIGHPHHPYLSMPTGYYPPHPLPMPTGYYPPHPVHCYPGCHPSCHTAATEPTTRQECSKKSDYVSDKASQKPRKDDKKLLNIKKYGQYRWVPTSIKEDNSFVIKDGLLIGTDVDGSDIYAARAKFSGDLIPGKFKPEKNMCTVTMCGQEATVDDFEVLIPSSFSWVEAMNGAVPPGAIPAGVCANGEKYYYGRVRHNDALIPGKMQPSHGNSYYGIDGNEFSSKKYEILVLL